MKRDIDHLIRELMLNSSQTDSAPPVAREQDRRCAPDDFLGVAGAGESHGEAGK
ncbi:hypothetical protein [Paraburkholderia sp. RL17-337-BIB-A]|uniref:hypothetical protein n=1 Tax=Paraburkholderia sp. RL17-337-BIB-A TaxID=3031636 RepID=UPI0038BBAC28